MLWALGEPGHAEQELHGFRELLGGAAPSPPVAGRRAVLLARSAMSYHPGDVMALLWCLEGIYAALARR
jgi:hypothetical protein